jgi:predicted aspartyl protease
VGKVTTRIRVTNRADEIRAADGPIPSDRVRSVELDGVLVYTGATTLCLPVELVARLGLEFHREVHVVTATGESTMRLFRDATLEILGRSWTFECVKLPEGRQPLLGVLPLEALGLEPDLANQALRLLPESGRDNYMTIL